MTQKYTYLTEEQRYQIQVLFAEGNSRGQIAKKIACHKSTVSREIKRNSVEGAYKAKFANELAKKRERGAAQKSKLIPILEEKFVRLLKEKWSPQQISGHLKKNSQTSISHESIYKYVWKDKKEGGDLYKHLRHASIQSAVDLTFFR